MKGIPYSLNTKSDYLNAFDYALRHPEYKNEVIARLERLRKSTFFMALKDEAFSKRAEKQNQDDYEEREDKNSLFRRIGFDNSGIDKMIEELKKC